MAHNVGNRADLDRHLGLLGGKLSSGDALQKVDIGTDHVPGQFECGA
jgi:hypothetical protein